MPVRTCAGCRRKRPQPELVRIARSPDGLVGIGRTLPGRGCWLCAGSSGCFDRAVRTRSLARGLRASVRDEDIERLRTDFMVLGSAARD